MRVASLAALTDSTACALEYFLSCLLNLAIFLSNVFIFFSVLRFLASILVAFILAVRLYLTTVLGAFAKTVP